ncbi:hypothetical protein ACFVZH_22810 [Streptomyces sp. NPDC059534]|uniref:hypothetical protein n=1 Tax=Streptomyces sp. NPDC059534 TaxID=3346859 RepID=UPI0036890C09
MLSRHASHDTSISDRRPAREAAEAALVENYPGLVRLAYLILPPALGRHRRVLTAHALVQRALPAAARRTRPETSRAGTTHSVPPGAEPSADAGGFPSQGEPPGPSLPGQRGAERPAHSWLRATVVGAALHPPRRFARPVPLPLVLGLRLFPRAGGSDELALDRALAGASPEVRAALALRTLEHLPEDAVVRLLASAGVAEPSAALRGAEELVAASGADIAELLRSAEFDPCTVQTRPTDLLRRSRHGRLAALAGALLLAATATVATAGLRSDPEPVLAGPASTGSAAGTVRSLDPAALVRAPADRWADTARVDFTAWPARGPRTGDAALLSRALVTWARGADGGARVTATPGTSTPPPAEPPRLLFAGTVDGADVVLLHDGRRLARYAEPRDGRGPVVLDLARADDADVTTGAAVVLGRTSVGTRFLLAPWIAEAAVRDLGTPGTAARPLPVDPDGVTAPVPYDAAPGTAGCARTTALQLRSSTRIVEDHAFLLADLGELTPVHLTWTPPPGAGAPPRAPREATGARGLAAWAHSACFLAELHGAGVRSVNRWEYADQPLPERAGRALWVCARADTWEGGARVALSFEIPTGGRRVAELRDTAACSRFGRHVLAGGYWSAPSGTRYFLAAGSRRVVGVTATGAVSATARAPMLAAKAPQAATDDKAAKDDKAATDDKAAADDAVRLTGRLADGSPLSGVTPTPAGPDHPGRPSPPSPSGG